jgi:hypothetical protein
MQRREFLQTGAAAGAAVQKDWGRGRLRAGVAAANITPRIGSSIAGSFTGGIAAEVHDELWVKVLVLDNGAARVALVAVDTCVLPARVCREAKALIGTNGDVPPANVMLCSTHTHSAAATLPVFQAEPDPAYLEFITGRIADAVRVAVRRLRTAKLGFGFGREERLVFNRRYRMRPGSIPPNPFGGIDRVRTNPGIGNRDVVGPAGPVDPVVGVMAVRTAEDKPLAVVGNYSLHYVGGVGSGHISADYFAWWAEEMTSRMGVATGPGEAPFIAMLTNGAQGDINNVDVMRGSSERQPAYDQIAKVARALATESERVLRSIEYTDSAVLASSQGWLDIGVRLPTQAEVAAARAVLAKAGEEKPYRDPAAVFARETIIMSQTYPAVERVPVQALRIGGAALAGLPGEPFVELGLELRAKSALRDLFVIGLANDHVGYVPAAEAHEQGGYETWRAKTSYLEKTAAARITGAMLKRIEDLAA